MQKESINVISYLLNKGFACDNDIFDEVHLKEISGIASLKIKMIRQDLPAKINKALSFICNC